MIYATGVHQIAYEAVGTNFSFSRLKNILCRVEMGRDFSTVRGYNFSSTQRFNKHMRKESPMYVIAVSICLLLFAVIFGANMLIANINSDELSNMGIEKKS
jgi:hypothetical protein